MNDVLSPYLRKFIIVISYDIMIYSKSTKAHVEHLRQPPIIFIFYDIMINSKSTKAHVKHLRQPPTILRHHKLVSTIKVFIHCYHSRHIIGGLGVCLTQKISHVC